MPTYVSEEEVFGRPRAQTKYLSEEEVFGKPSVKYVSEAEVFGTSSGEVATGQPAGNFPTPKTKRTFGETLSDTGAQLAEGVNSIAGAVPSLVAPESDAAQFFQDNSKFWQGKQSDALKGRIDAASQKIDAAGQDGIIAQMVEAATQYSSDPALAARFVVTNLPSLIPGVGAAKLAQAAALARGASAMKAAAIATSVSGGANAVLNAGGARGDAFDDIKQTLMTQGLSEAEATQRAIEDSRLPAVVGGVAGFVSGKTGLEHALVGKAAATSTLKGMARAGAGSTVAELAGEQLEEVLPKLTTNYQAGQYDDRSLGQDVGRTVVETAIGAGPGSIAAGGATAIQSRMVHKYDPATGRSKLVPADAPPAVTEPTTAAAEVPPAKTPYMPPRARLAELDLLSESRELTSLERGEAQGLLTQMDADAAGYADDAAMPEPSASPPALVPDAEPMDQAAGAATVAAEPVAPSLPAQSPIAVPSGEYLSEAEVFGKPTDFWSYAQDKGFKAGELKVGSPEWAALKSQYDQLSGATSAPANTAPLSTTRTVPAPTDLTGSQPIAPAPEIDSDLQNRDRSRTASVAQMTSIANNPDYMRLGPSRTPDSGAPMVFPQGDDTQAVPLANYGHKDVAVMSDGLRVPFQYAVVDANTVQASNFVNGAANSQYQDTTPGTLKALNNGRTAGIQAAHAMGKAGSYTEELKADAQQHGIPASVIEQTRNPLLVRLYSQASNTPDMAAKSQGQGLGMSPVELARQDAKLIDASVLSVYQPGDVSVATNRDFVRAFAGRLHESGQDLSSLMTSTGELSASGRQRIQAALMQAAYSDTDLVNEMFDSTHTDIKAIGESLKAVAGEWAGMRDAARSGTIDPGSDVTANLMQAVQLVQKARRERLMLSDLVNQTDLLTGTAVDPATVGMLRLFYSGQHFTRAMGREQVMTGLRKFIEAAHGTSTEPDMFGHQASASDILNAIIGETNGQLTEDTTGQPDAFGTGGNAPGPDGQEDTRQVDGATRDRPAESGQGIPQAQERAAGPGDTGSSEGTRATEGQDAELNPGAPVSWLLPNGKTASGEVVRTDKDGKLTAKVTSAEPGAGVKNGAVFMVTPEARVLAPKIEDLGEKIGGARKDTAQSTGSTKKAKSADVRPAWARRFDVSEIAASSRAEEVGKWSISDNKNLDWQKQPKRMGALFDTQAEAEAAVPLVAVALKHRAVPTRDGKYEIWRDISDRKRVKVVDQTFDAREDALRYMLEHAVQIIETSTTFGEADLPKPPSFDRQGVARRQGDVDGKDFMDAFGFRGVEFGNWNNQAERQELMNAAYDGLIDLSEVLGMPPKALALNGDLALAFGARGHGLSGAKAHYESDRVVMNLTKMNGAGSLAHEWFHALDHYFARQDGKTPSAWKVGKDGTRTLDAKGGESDMASAGFRSGNSGVRPEIRAAYKSLMEALYRKAEQYVKDTQKADKFVAAARNDVTKQLADIRGELAEQKDVRYYKRNNKPASADQLAEFDTVADQIVTGVAVDTEFRSTKPGASARNMSGMRWTNDALEKISEIYKAVRGRQGFSTSNDGLLDRLRSSMSQYSARLKMLADAQNSTEKTKKVPTDFAMDAKSLDQGRGTDYWTTYHEMAARAFQGYVQDKIAEQGGTSPFLNYGPENVGIETPWGWKRPFPAGAERIAINQEFDKLVSTIQTKETDQGVAMFSRANATGKLTDAAVRSVAEHMASRWANTPVLVVVKDMQDDRVPQRVRDADAEQTSLGAKGTPEGFYSGGKVYLVASAMQSNADIARVLFHEVLGHHGLRGAFGEALDPILKQIASARPELMQPKAKQYGLDLSNPDHRLRVAEEVLAEMAQTKPDLGFVQRAVAAIRTWLRQNVPGLQDMHITDAEIIRSYILPARGFVERGTFDKSALSADKAPTTGFSRSVDDQPLDPIENPNPWQRAKAKVEELTSPEAITKLIYEFRDKFIDLKNLRDHIKAIEGTVTDLNDAYLGEELYHKRLAKRTEDFLDKELRPLLADMRARAVSMTALEQYLHARHAPEANAAMARHNPSGDEVEAGRTKAKRQVTKLETELTHATNNASATKALQESLSMAREELSRWQGAQAFKGDEDKRHALSGMSDDEAMAIITSLSPERAAHMQALAARVDAINAKTLDALEKYGLMDQESVSAWRRQYEFYVPLHRDEANADTSAHPIGQGFSVKGAAAKSRMGSNEKVTNILAHVALQRETALTRGEKNHVVKKLYLLAAQNPDEEVWELDKPPMIKSMDANGFVRKMVDPGYKNRPNVVMVRIAGRDQAIVFNKHNPEMVRLAGAVKNLDVGDLHVVLGLAAKGTRWFASVNTQYNPIFGLINFARDAQDGMLNLSTTPLNGKQKQVASHVFEAMRAIYRAERGKAPKSAEWAKLWEEMQDVGGTTGYRDLFSDVSDRVKSLEKELKALDRGDVSKAAHAVVDWLSHYNEAMENAVRLSAYKVARDQGMSKERAASLAKNLTVNFNRKGRQTREIGALYAFFNAAVQGTTRMAQTLKGPLGKKIMLGGVMIGAVNALIGMAVMGGGDDGEDDSYGQVQEFMKERSLVIPLSHDDYIAIPMPLGFRIFPNIGRLAVEFAFGGPDKTLGSQLGKLLFTLVDAFNPIGGGQNIGQMVAPTVIDPVVALMQNRDWTGRPIYRENRDNLDPQPGSRMMKDSASTPSRLIADAINSITGGSEYRPGAWSPTPDQLDYVVGQLTGGLGRELIKANQTLTAPFTGDDLPAYKIPLVGRIYGNTRGSAGQSQKFYENMTELNMVKNEIIGRSRNDDSESVDEYRASEPLSKIIGISQGYESTISKLRTVRREITRRAEPGFQERVKEIDVKTGELMTRFNNEVAKARNAR